MRAGQNEDGQDGLACPFAMFQKAFPGSFVLSQAWADEEAEVQRDLVKYVRRRARKNKGTRRDSRYFMHHTCLRHRVGNQICF